MIVKAEDRAEAEAVEAQVIAAWIKWYGEAFESVTRLPVSGLTPALMARLEAARRALK